jgi:phenylacetic acid degradation operon negative regulatory protein
MKRKLDIFCYEDLLDCIELLRRRTDTRVLYEIIAWVGAIAADFNLSDAFRYLARKGKLLRNRRAGETTYELAPGARTTRAEELKRRKHAEGWDGEWSLLSYDIPVSDNRVRRKLARLLRQLGFAPVSRSTWLSPYDWLDVLPELLGDVPQDSVMSYVRARTIVSLGGRDVPCSGDCWPLDGLARCYRQVITTCAGAPPGRDSRSRSARIHSYVHASRLMARAEADDPLLPRTLLPADWPRPEALKERARIASAVRSDVELAIQKR